MAYDPKKKRPSTKSLDSVVDEIFGEESTESKPAKAEKSKPAAKSGSKAKTGTPTSKKKPAAKTDSKTSKTSKPKVEPIKAEKSEINEEIPDNVTPLYPEPKETPLVMQPQVWIATAIGALALLLIIRKRK